MHTFVLLLLLTTSLFTPTQQQKQIINFAFFYPFESNEISQPETYNATQIIQYGIEQFESLPIATKYELKVQIFDSNCNARDGIRAYIEMLQLPEFFPFIIGPACSLAAEPVALDITTTNILSVSYYAASPQFANNTLFPNFFRLFPPEETVLNARVNFINSQGWNRVAIVLQSLSVFTSSIRLLQDQLMEEEIESELFLVFDEAAIGEVLDDLFDAQYNILIGLFYPEFANTFLCSFYNRERSTAIQYVWLLDGWLPVNFYSNTFGGCQSEDLRDLLDYSIFFTNYFLTNESEPTTLGPSFQQFHNEFNSTIIEDDIVFDSFTTMVVAIQLYEEQYGTTCGTDSSCLGDYNYSTPKITDRLREILYELKFQGISGEIMFTETGDRTGNVSLQQSFGGVRVEIGFSSGTNDYVFVNGVTWRGGIPPGDGSTVRFSYIYLSQFIVFSILAVAGVTSSVVYILVTLIKWKHGAISSNTPLLTLTTLIGSIVIYIATIIMQVPNLENYIIEDLPGFAVTCSVINWMLTIGFTLTYYPLFLKMVYAFYLKEYTVKNQGRRKRKFQLEELHLLVILAGCVILDVLFLMLWTAIPQIRFVRTTDSLSTIQDGLPELVIEYNCGVELELNERIIVSLVVISKVLVLMVAMVIAFDTRSLKYKKHRENVWVGISLYTVAVFGIIGIVCNQFILRQADLRSGLVTLCIVAAVFATTSLLFVPLIVLLVKDKKGLDYGVELGPKNSPEDQGARESILRLENENRRLLREADRLRSNSQNKLLGSGEMAVEGRPKSESVL